MPKKHRFTQRKTEWSLENQSATITDKVVLALKSVLRIVRHGRALLTKIERSKIDPAKSQVLCPVCGFDFVHHEDQAVVIDGDDAYKAAPGQVRGSVIAVPMYCEEGHNFTLCFGFHKGNMFTWCATNKGKRK